MLCLAKCNCRFTGICWPSPPLPIDHFILPLLLFCKFSWFLMSSLWLGVLAAVVVVIALSSSSFFSHPFWCTVWIEVHPNIACTYSHSLTFTHTHTLTHWHLLSSWQSTVDSVCVCAVLHSVLCLMFLVLLRRGLTVPGVSVVAGDSSSPTIHSIWFGRWDKRPTGATSAPHCTSAHQLCLLTGVPTKQSQQQ